ncbi:MAG: glycosyltransferase family 2 protein [Coleofasciculaceae cyanobacterium SM2_1_6]|nr:glycosyltransferase family 2 protein [Coleofasciculaceae cyanobacterium SM2_1_6]
MSMVKISAVICTHNRQDYLARAIESLLAQDFLDYEVILVNNASTDGTAELAQNYLNQPQFHYIYEPVLGLSTARNTGAVAAQGEIIAYLDDDAVASPGWLRVLSTAFTGDQKLAIAGGKVTLILPPEQSLPWWISPNLASNLGAYDLGNKKVDIHQPGLTPRGLNYAIRRQFWVSMGGFAVNLGRKGKNLLSNEEVHATEVALRQGWRVAYLPEAIVAHQVVPERLKPQWFLHRAWWQGISEYQYQQVTITYTPQELKAAAQRMLRGCYKSLKYLPQPSLSFENLVYTYGQLGYFSAVIAGLGGRDLL